MSAKAEKPQIGQQFTRTLTIERAEMNDEARTVELSFSSETPADRYWGVEILDHSAGSIHLDRLNSGGALLMEHDRRDQVGVVEKAWLDTSTRKARAKVRFGKSSRATEIWNDVKDGIRQLISCQYEIRQFQLESEKDGVETYRIKDWEPLEISLVSVPVDTAVGIGRGHHQDQQMHLPQKNLEAAGTAVPAPPPQTPPAPVVQVVSEPRRALDDERTRVNAIMTIAALHKTAIPIEEAQRAISEGTTVQDFQTNILKRYKDGAQPTPLDPRPTLAGPETQAANPGTNFNAQVRGAKGPGDMLVESQSYKDGITRGKVGARSVSVEIPNWGQRTTLTSSGLTGYERPPGVVVLEQQPLLVGMLFSQGTTTQPTIRVLKETAYTNAATAVAEEGSKPEQAFTLAETDFPVKKIAAVGRVTDEMFSDFPQVRDYVNSRLAYMVGAIEDNHLLNGDGNSNKITGILNTSTVQTVAAPNYPSPVVALHKAITKVRAVGFFEPDYIVLNPYDWENVKLTPDLNGQFLFGGPGNGPYGVGNYMVAGLCWGLPVVSTTSLAQGTALVGAFRLGAQLFRRDGLTIDTTNSDASDFQYNRICIRAETRLALAVYRPLAFCTVTGIPATP